jgi:hypothetical protein
MRKRESAAPATAVARVVVPPRGERAGWRTAKEGKTFFSPLLLVEARNPHHHAGRRSQTLLLLLLHLFLLLLFLLQVLLVLLRRRLWLPRRHPRPGCQWCCPSLSISLSLSLSLSLSVRLLGYGLDHHHRQAEEEETTGRLVERAVGRAPVRSLWSVRRPLLWPLCVWDEKGGGRSEW